MAKILIIDDDPDVVEATSVVLKGDGHEVASAASRDEGMNAVDAEEPDLLVLDVMMDEPDDGFQMAQDLRRKGFDKPILMLTSISKLTGMDFGGDDDVNPVDEVAEKPINPDKLLEKVKELLDGKES